MEQLYEQLLTASVWDFEGERDFPYQLELDILIADTIEKSKEFVNFHLKANNEPQLVKVFKAMRWMEQSLGKRKGIPFLNASTLRGFELTELIQETSEESSE